MQTQSEKERILRAVANLPDDATIEDAIDSLVLLAKIDCGVRQLDAGEGVSHKAARSRFLTAEERG